MNKRAFLEGFFTASTVAFGGLYMWRRLQPQQPLLLTGASQAQQTPSPTPLPPGTTPGIEPLPPAAETGFQFTEIQIRDTQPAKGLPRPAPAIDPVTAFNLEQLDDEEIDGYLRKIRNFDAIFPSDIYLDTRYEPLLLKTSRHLARVEAYMGHGNFNLMSFDEMLRAGSNFSQIGAFEPDELNFLEEVFFANPTRYGFFGKKISREITEAIPRNGVAKIANSGHYLLKGESLNLYNQLHRDVGEDLILTSGVRSIVKQMHLFLAKTIEARGNLSRASRSLAPPGHSYHGIGDFDIGKLGFGERNFTADFSSTEEYQTIARLGYVDIRYPTDNLFGVRFEPWHIKLG
ncbi:MAG: M15 family metallopeptidase [Pseudohongiellaceae bacterium]